MTATVEPPTTEPADGDGPGLGERWLALPTALRWMAYVAGAMLILTMVQSFEDGNALTGESVTSAMLRRTAPILLAGLGGLVSERAGVVNIGLEGMMILGMWCGAYGALEWGPWGGVVFGLVGGALGGLLHAVATVTFGVDHIISGVAIILVSGPIARYLSDIVFSDYEGGSITQSPRVSGTSSFSIPLLAGGFDGPDFLHWVGDRDWPYLSDIADAFHGVTADVSWFTLVAFLMVPLVAFVLWRTRFGLRLRSCGEDPTGADSLGVNVYLHKYIAVVASGGLAGLGGAFIAIEQSQIYRQGQVAGRGFIGLATLIFGNWRPGGTALGALLFGYIDGLNLADLSGTGVHGLLLVIAIALVGVMVLPLRSGKRVDAGLAGGLAVAFVVWYLVNDDVPTPFANVAPYAVTLLVLVFASQRLRMPKADGLRWRKGDH